MLFSPQNRSADLVHPSTPNLTGVVRLSLSHLQALWSFPYRTAPLKNPWRSSKPYQPRQCRALMGNLRSVRPGKPSPYLGVTTWFERTP